MIPEQQSVEESLRKRGVTRRDFLKLCAVMAATLAMPKTVHAEI